MSTTTIRLDEELRARVTAAAKRAGKSAHAFIVDAIAQNVEQAEMEDQFHGIADERWAKIVATGKAVPWDEARAYLEARARSERASKPRPRKVGTR